MIDPKEKALDTLGWVLILTGIAVILTNIIGEGALFSTDIGVFSSAGMQVLALNSLTGTLMIIGGIIAIKNFGKKSV